MQELTREQTIINLKLIVADQQLHIYHLSQQVFELTKELEKANGRPEQKVSADKS